MSDRIKKLNDLLRDETGKILEHELEKVDGVLVTVTGADISPTLEHANIRISVFPLGKAGDIIKNLEKLIYRVQHLLNRRLKMHPVPKIRFEIDKTEERAAHIEEVLGKIVK